MARGTKHEEAPKGSPMWMTTYSDLVSLLMCFFIMLFAMSSVDAEMFNAFAAGMARSESLIDFGEDNIMNLMSAGILELPLVNLEVMDPGEHTGLGQGENPGQSGNNNQDEPSAEYLEMQAQFEENARKLQTYFAETNLSESVHLEVGDQSIILSFAEGVMFDSGQAVLKKQAIDALAACAEIMKDLPGIGIRIEGHTDSNPIHTVAYPTNGHLSYARAYAVEEYLVSVGLEGTKMQTSGYGDKFPLDTNDTPEGRANNRRVEIVIMSQYYTSTGQPRE